MLEEKYTPQEGRVLAVFDRHLAAFLSGDLDAVVGDYADDAILVTPDGAFVGPEGARLVFGALLAEFGNIGRGDSRGFKFNLKHVHGDTLYITWHAESKNCVFPFGTDTLISDGEKITRQSISFSPVLPRVA